MLSYLVTALVITSSLFCAVVAFTAGDDAAISTLRVQHAQGTITVGPDAWVRFRAPARIGVLIKHLRKALDVLLAAKLDDPSLDIAASPIIDAVVRLLVSSGI